MRTGMTNGSLGYALVNISSEKAEMEVPGPWEHHFLSHNPFAQRITRYVASC